MTKNTKQNFHDCGVTGFVLDQTTIRLHLERFNEKDKIYTPVSLIFSDVRDVRIDDVPSFIIKPVYDDGEIIHFEITGGKILLIIQWNDFKNKKTSTKSYEFKFDAMEQL